MTELLQDYLGEQYRNPDQIGITRLYLVQMDTYSKFSDLDQGKDPVPWHVGHTVYVGGLRTEGEVRAFVEKMIPPTVKILNIMCVANMAMPAKLTDALDLPFRLFKKGDPVRLKDTSMTGEVTGFLYGVKTKELGTIFRSPEDLFHAECARQPGEMPPAEPEAPKRRVTMKRGNKRPTSCDVKVGDRYYVSQSMLVPAHLRGKDVIVVGGVTKGSPDIFDGMLVVEVTGADEFNPCHIPLVSLRCYEEVIE